MEWDVAPMSEPLHIAENTLSPINFGSSKTFLLLLWRYLLKFHSQ